MGDMPPLLPFPKQELAMTRGEIRLSNETLAELPAYLVTRGVPLPPGAIREPRQVSVVKADGRPLPAEGRVLQRRPDGSIEWVLMDILVPLKGQEKTSLFVELKPRPPVPVRHPVTLQQQKGVWTLSNGQSAVTVTAEGGSLIQRLVINGRGIVKPGQTVDLEVADVGGKIHRASLFGPYTLRVLDQNRLRTTIALEGKHRARDGATFLDFTLRFTLTANSPDLKIEHTFYCREPKEGIIRVRSIRLVMPTTFDPAAVKLLRQINHGEDCRERNVTIRENVEVVASATGDLDNYAATFPGPKAAHPSAGGSVFIRNWESLKEDFSAMPFHMRPGQGSGFRAFNNIHRTRIVHPAIGWQEEAFTLVTSFEHFRQLHPKSILIDESTLVYGIWPEWSVPMEIVMGVSKSHILWLTGERRALDMDEVLDVYGRWEYGYVEPVDISFDPAWPAACEVLDCHHLLKYQPDKYPLLENLIEPVPAAGNPARHTYDRLPAIGMFHFGDQVNPDGTHCTNNEDDINVFFPLQHFLRTGQTYAWDHGKECARHYMEVDFCEWSTDPRQKGGLIPHTGQHFIGCVYPSHQWAEGLLAYYYLSGDERARRAVIGCADNHVWWIYHKTDMVCCDGREAGMPLVNLAAAYRLTRDRKYLRAARHLIRNFFLKWEKRYGVFQYPYPQTAQNPPHKLIRGYGDWSSFAGLYRLWEVTGEEFYRKLGVRLLDTAIQPDRFTVNDIRGMDFFAAWALGRMTGDMDEVIRRTQRAVPMLLRRGGHPLRRLHFLKELDERGMIDDRQAGTRPGAI